jgi:hypothetical protein
VTKQTKNKPNFASKPYKKISNQQPFKQTKNKPKFTSKPSQNFSKPTALKTNQNCEFWFRNKPSGNPVVL